LLLIGLFNVIGSLGSGVISHRFSKAGFLVLIYLARAAAITVFITLPQTPTTIVIFAAVVHWPIKEVSVNKNTIKTEIYSSS
jgi:predicted MFS family arabinose efflux permease